jgi:predicted GNAT family N-acyltransferase
MISVLAENLVDFYLTVTSRKEFWDAPETKYGVSDTGSELYVMEQLCDYKMVDDHSIMEQAHEMQSLAKELEGFKCVTRLVCGRVHYYQTATYLDRLCHFSEI